MSFIADYSKIENLKDSLYVEPNFLEEILENSTKMNTTELNSYINSLSIKLTSHEIEKYLEEKLKIDNKDAYLYKHSQKNESIVPISRFDVNKKTKEMTLDVIAKAYTFNPKALSMFKFDSSIARNRLFSLLILVEKISNKKYAISDQNLRDLDIRLDGNGDIKVADIKRIITPFIYLLNYLVQKTTVANDLESYFDFTGPEFYDWYESQTNQTCLLQLKGIGTQEVEGYIPLTDNQIETIAKEQKENFDRSMRQWVRTSPFFKKEETKVPKRKIQTESAS